MFKSSALDTLVPAAAGAANLGTVTVDGGTSKASISTTFADLLSALGLDSATATTIGAIDDVCLRYVNPDIDGDGTIVAVDGQQINPDAALHGHSLCPTGPIVFIG